MIARLKSYLINILSWYSLVSYPLFLFTIFILIFVISSLDRGIHLNTLRLIVLLAAIFGLALSLLRNLKPITHIILSFSSGVMVVFTIIGELIQPFATYLNAGFNYLLSLIRIGVRPNPTQVQDQWSLLQQNVNVLYERQVDWLLTYPEAVYDPVSINLTWGIIVWLTTIWVYWLVIKRKQVVVGFLPPLVILAAAVPSIESGLVWLFLILGIGLLLALLSRQSSLEEHWQKKKFTASELIRRNTVKYSLYLSAGLVLFSGLITSPEIEEFFDNIRERRQQSGSQGEGTGSEGRAGASFPEDEETTIGPEEVLDETADGWLPNVHLIGSPPELAEIEVFSASVQEPNTGLSSRYYFRSATYETYDLKGWRNIDKDYSLIPPEEEFEIDFTPNEKLLYQEVNLLRDFQKGNLMIVVGELAAANVPYYASFHTKFVNNTYTDLFASVTDATQYSAYSVTPFFGAADLRNTTQEYPAWIENKYLQLPDSVPDRVIELALSLTATQPTPYDRVLAIESYLRSFEYSLEIEDPPRFQDLVDYFLFDLQKGYCDYYASAMVVLTRAAGIPARLATGYLASTYDPEAGHFIVTEDQAHSWVEVYFPDFGWVTFEPTAGQPALVRQDERELPTENLALETDLTPQVQEPESNTFTLIPANLFILTGELLILALLGLIAFHQVERLLLARMVPVDMLSRVYHRLHKLSKRMGIQTNSTNTPLEFSRVLSEALETLSTNRTMRLLLASAPHKAANIIEVCNQAAYTREPVNIQNIRQVITEWGKLRWQLILARMLIQLQPVQSSLKRIWFRLQQPA